MNQHAQVMKAPDFEKYVKEKYGGKWHNTAAKLANGLTLDKNQSLTFFSVQTIIELFNKQSILYHYE